ncbi:MAG TPA: hypothetical protein VD833_19675 [Vicinamibacterales bacterium]|nr:hypothetical protein [Vicinamibacterales bacterium]
MPRLPEGGLPGWAPLAALASVLLLAWPNFLLTGKWADLPGALNGWRQPWYAAALVAATVLIVATRHHVGTPARIGRAASWTLLAAGAGMLVAALFSRLPLSTWNQIPFKDDYTPLYQAAVNGVHLLQRGSVVGWNWWLLGGYPTSTDIAQSFGALAFVPMVIFGEQVGYHVLHAVVFLAIPALVWWDIRQEDRGAALLAGGFACLFTAGYFAYIGNSGDTNSVIGAFCTALALIGSRAARLGRRWGGPLLLAGLTLALYSHVAFCVYAGIYLLLEAAYYRDLRAVWRLAAAGLIAVVVSLPVHWESLRYPQFVSFNNTVYDPGAPLDWALFARTLYYNVEMLLLPHRWFNDYRSLANVWLPVLVVMALAPGRSRVGFYAGAAVLTQVLLRLNTSEAGALFDRIQHMLPVVTGPALAGFVLRFGGTRRLALALVALIGLYVATSFVPVRHVPDLRAFDPPLIDRIAAADGNMILVEVSPHRDMDSDPGRRSPRTPFDVHFEGLLPSVAGQRFYSQMWDGWIWHVLRGQVVGAGTFAGRAIEETPPEAFVAEMRRWGVRHLFVWTDAMRAYLSADPRFVQRWRGGLWSHFELEDADTRSVVTTTGSGRLQSLDFLSGEVALADVMAGSPVVVRANYYPAWRAHAAGREVPLYASDGQLAFRAPETGSYIVRFEYPRYRWLSILALGAASAGLWVMSGSSEPRRHPARSAA